jgi:murein DD-endopeptidase MepM/ murein hydrolase activator NlpD
MRYFSTLLSSLLALIQFSIAVEIQLPTENRYLLSGEPEKFYMYVDRYFDGTHTMPWEGGSYGFVRTSVRVGDQIIQTKFHEGIDIAPIKRDKAGNPLDLVSSIAAGKVVYVSDIGGRSNYGKYVVVAHLWENSQILSLYAHLAEITCKVDDQLAMGGLIGRMGYTGEGITRVRAHTHLELALMLSGRYQDFTPTVINYHGLYNGINLAGMDVAAFFLAQKTNPQLNVSEFLASYPIYYKVTIPNSGHVEIATRYPWLVKTDPEKKGVSWEIAFSHTGMPLSIVASDRSVTKATVTMVRASDIPHSYKTRGLLSGEGMNASLSKDGLSLVNLLSGNFPVAPVTPEKKKP